MIPLVITISLNIALIGCATPNRQSPNEYLSEERNNLLMQGRSPSYSDGYIDGCASGKNNVGDSRFNFSKNTNRYSAEKDYYNGWEQGFQFCREEELNMMEQKRDVAKDEFNEQQKRSLESKEADRMWDEMRK